MTDHKTCKIRLAPVGVEITAAKGDALKDLLFEQGVEFPCGGAGRCRGCRVRIVAGDMAITPIQRERLSADELKAGWRMACQCTVESDLTLELRQWDAEILSNDTGFAFTPQPGLGIAVDLGTTTLVAQLLDLSTGRVLAVKTALNPQARHGGDVMSRVEFAAADHGGVHMRDVIRGAIGRLVHNLLSTAQIQQGPDVRKVAIVGNTAMHHLFCGIDIEPLSHYPFEPVNDGLQQFSGADFDWPLAKDAVIEFLPCLGGFVGSDILAGIVATRLSESEKLTCLIDLGTNGEIVVGNKDRFLCASTAAGPAFEGARIAMGMRAATGAIWKVEAADGQLKCSVLGNTEPRGICGSGLVDAAASSLNVGLVGPSGRIQNRATEIMLLDPIKITQCDIRELQLAKGAIATGIKLLLQRWGAQTKDVSRVCLAGAFGNYIDRANAHRIGLLPFSLDQIEAAGNTALLGAKILLCAPDSACRYASLLARSEHISLNTDPQFQDMYVEEMGFPEDS